MAVFLFVLVMLRCVRPKTALLVDIELVRLGALRTRSTHTQIDPSGLGIDRQAVVSSLQAQNAIQPSGVVEAGAERISLRVDGQFISEESLRAINLRVKDRFFRLGDVANISRGYLDPPIGLFRFNGQPAIGLAIAMRKNGNILNFGAALKARMKQVESELPLGIDIHMVSDQSKVVALAVDGFTGALVEAILIVLAVSFISLGVRAGLVVSIAIPLVLAMVFVVMEAWGITLQRISLGAPIIALGLLVDDAMITVEMMVARLELGDNLTKAATFAYSSTAFPMLTGTLVTVAGFLPIGFNGSSAGEYTFSMFVVIAAALLLSWIVAVLFAPLIGVLMLPKQIRKRHGGPSRLSSVFNAVLLRAMRLRWITVAVTVALLGVAIVGMNFVQQQFFPSSDRPELLVDFTLPQNSSINETKRQMDRFEENLKNDPDIVRWSSYVGLGAIRFYLPLDQQLPNAFFGQLVVETKNVEARDRVSSKLVSLAQDQFTGIDVFVHTLDLGPPVGRAIQYRLTGTDLQTLRQQALGLANVVGGNSHLMVPTFDWNEPGKAVHIDILQDKARQLGITSEDISSLLSSIVGGSSITQVRDSIYLVDVTARAQSSERTSLDALRSLQIPLPNGSVVPLLALANLYYDLEQPIVWRRDRLPTITVKASIVDDTQPATIVQELKPAIERFAAALPAEYTVATGGAVEESAKGSGPIAAVAPLMLLTMALILMVQLQSVQKLFLVASVAPLGLIGVVAVLLISGKPLGFVAILGVLALIGIIIRNSVILVTQIDAFHEEGLSPWRAVVEATHHRMRPILLTAAAASLGMIPIAREVFWGPMAYAMIGGIVAATLLTLFFLPALYVSWYRIEEDGRDPAPAPLSRQPDPVAALAE